MQQGSGVLVDENGDVAAADDGIAFARRSLKAHLVAEPGARAATDRDPDPQDVLVTCLGDEIANGGNGVLRQFQDGGLPSCCIIPSKRRANAKGA